MITRLEVEEDFRKDTIQELVEDMSSAIEKYSETEMKKRLLSAHKYSFLVEKFAGIRTEVTPAAS